MPECYSIQILMIGLFHGKVLSTVTVICYSRWSIIHELWLSCRLVVHVLWVCDWLLFPAHQHASVVSVVSLPIKAHDNQKNDDDDETQCSTNPVEDKAVRYTHITHDEVLKLNPTTCGYPHQNSWNDTKWNSEVHIIWKLLIWNRRLPLQNKACLYVLHLLTFCFNWLLSHFYAIIIFKFSLYSEGSELYTERDVSGTFGRSLKWRNVKYVKEVLPVKQATCWHLRNWLQFL